MKIHSSVNSKKAIPLAVAIIIALTLLFLMTGRYGPGMNGDSAAYLSSAESLLAGRGYRIYLGPALTKWPPLYPTLIAVGMLFGITAKTSAILLNALCITFVLFLANHWLRSQGYSLPIIALGLALILFAPPLLEMLANAWTEVLYITLSLLFMVILGAWLLPPHLSTISVPTPASGWQQKVVQFIGTKHDWLIVLAGIVSALAFSTRYIGYTIILTGGLIILFRPHLAILRRLKLLIIFGCLSVFPLIPWWLRTYIASSSIVGQRFPATVSWEANLSGTWQIIQEWLAPDTILNGRPLDILTGLLMVCVLLLPLWTVLLNKQTKQVWQTETKDELAVTPLVHSLPASLYVVIYLVCLLITSSLITGTDRMNPRLLSPIYVFIPLVLLDVIMYFARSRQPRQGHYRTWIITGLLSIWLIYPITLTVELAQWGQEYGLGIYNIKRWSTSPAVAYIDELPEGVGIITNEPHLLYVNKGVFSYLSPRTYGQALSSEPLQSFLQYIPDDRPLYLFWFELSPQRMSLFYSVEQMREAVDLELIASFGDQGDVYRLERKSEP